MDTPAPPSFTPVTRKHTLDLKWAISTLPGPGDDDLTPEQRRDHAERLQRWLNDPDGPLD